MQDVAAVGSFFNEQWALYEKIARCDYLGHHAFYTRLREHLGQRTEPFGLLELGCGDARFTRTFLQGLPLSWYRGVDLAQEALELVHLEELGCPVQLICGSLLEVLRTDTRPAPVVLASFSVHHLSKAEKGELFTHLAALIPAGGELLMLDIVRRPGEDRPAYLERRHAHERADWTECTPHELELVREHEDTADFPETREELSRLAEAAGFQPARSLAGDPPEMAELLVFAR